VTGRAVAAHVPRLRQIRVLLISLDARFLRVTAFLLRRRAYAVVTAASRKEGLRILARGEADVVVDGSGPLGVAVRLAAAVEALYPHVAVLIAADPLPASVPGVRVVPKYCPPDELAAAIEHAYSRRGDLPD
jgi:CheY-like chemotaxis protein